MSDVTVLETEISPEEKALNELHAKIVDLQMIVETIMKMRKEKLFRFLSKKTRNELMISMVEVAADVKDGAQAARDALKKNKRIRVPEELVDALLVENRLAAIVISLFAWIAEGASGLPVDAVVIDQQHRQGREFGKGRRHRPPGLHWPGFPAEDRRKGKNRALAGSLSTVMSPPMSPTSRLVMARPSPVPPKRRV